MYYRVRSIAQAMYVSLSVLVLVCLFGLTVLLNWAVYASVLSSSIFANPKYSFSIHQQEQQPVFG